MENFESRGFGKRIPLNSNTKLGNNIEQGKEAKLW